MSDTTSKIIQDKIDKARTRGHSIVLFANTDGMGITEWYLVIDNGRPACIADWTADELRASEAATKVSVNTWHLHQPAEAALLRLTALAEEIDEMSGQDAWHALSDLIHDLNLK